MADFAALPIVYDVDRDHCPAQVAFIRELERKGASADELASAGELHVVIKRAGSVWLGHVTQGELERSVKGENCEEVAMVLAFAVAVVRTKPEPDPVTVGPSPKPLPLPARPPIALVVRDVPFAQSWSIAAGGGLKTSVAPNDVPFVNLEFASVWRRNLSARMLFASPLVAFGRTETLGDGAATFRLVGVSVGACPFGLRADRFALFPCVGGEFGQLFVSLQEKFERPWIAVGPSLRVSLRIGDALWLDFNAFEGFNAVRDWFTLRGGVVHRPAALGFSFGAQIRWSPE